MNKAGYILAVTTIMSVFTVAAHRRYYDNRQLDNANSCIINIDSLPRSFAIEARCAMPNNKASRRSCSSWRLLWDYADSANYYYAQLAIDYSNHVDGVDTPAASISLGQCCNGTSTPTTTTQIRSGLNFDIGYNTMAIEWHDGYAYALIGNNKLRNAGTMPCPSPAHTQCGIMSTDSLRILHLITESAVSPARRLQTAWTYESIIAYLRTSNDSIEGLWQHFDRENDPTKARMGGTYTIASIWNPELKAYELLYVAGATINKQEWIPGMRKGLMSPTIFNDRFALVWYDAMCTHIEQECNAEVTYSHSILALHFPLMGSQIRLSRIPRNQY